MRGCFEVSATQNCFSLLDDRAMHLTGDSRNDRCFSVPVVDDDDGDRHDVKDPAFPPENIEIAMITHVGDLFGDIIAVGRLKFYETDVNMGVVEVWKEAMFRVLVDVFENNRTFTVLGGWSEYLLLADVGESGISLQDIDYIQGFTSKTFTFNGVPSVQIKANDVFYWFESFTFLDKGTGGGYYFSDEDYAYADDTVPVETEEVWYKKTCVPKLGNPFSAHFHPQFILSSFEVSPDKCSISAGTPYRCERTDVTDAQYDIDGVTPVKRLLSGESFYLQTKCAELRRCEGVQTLTGYDTCYAYGLTFAIKGRREAYIPVENVHTVNVARDGVRLTSSGIAVSMEEDVEEKRQKGVCSVQPHPSGCPEAWWSYEDTILKVLKEDISTYPTLATPVENPQTLIVSDSAFCYSDAQTLTVVSRDDYSEIASFSTPLEAFGSAVFYEKENVIIYLDDNATLQAHWVADDI